MKINLTKYIASSGYCSRRKAEELIRLGKVDVNGALAELGAKVNKHDQVIVAGKKIEYRQEKIYIALNKPIGYTCSNRKFKGEKNIFELLGGIDKETLSTLHIAGRLDKNSRGLVLLTNDGDLTAQLTHPRYEHAKYYLVTLETGNRKLEIAKIMDNFKKGIDIGEGDGVVKTKSIEYLDNGKFKIVLTEGKKRQIRRMFKNIGYEVADLRRIGIGNLNLGNLDEGKWKIV